MKTAEGWLWYDYTELNSTNDEALRLSLQSGDARVVVTAERQTHGRGRRGRSWIGLDGNLFMSQILPWPPQNCGILCLMCSLAILQAIKHFCPTADVKLKWPNDVLLGGKKVSGILLETGAEQKIICGIGVNIAAAPQDENLLYAAACLHDCATDCKPAEFMRQYLRQFNQLYNNYLTDGAKAIAQLWQQNAHCRGEQVTVRLPKKEISGLYHGLDANGFLLLQTADNKIITISAGDVFTAERKENR